MRFEAGKRYRLRLVNAAADNHFRFMIDAHSLMVIAADFVPIIPYETKDLSIGMGQRYDVIVEAKNTTGKDFWLRAYPQESCSETDALDNIKGIIRYSADSTDGPSSSAWNYTDSCADELSSNLVPYLALNASDVSHYNNDETVGVQVTDNALLWIMNSTTFRTAWENPTLLQLAKGYNDWTAKEQVVALPDADKWVYMVVHSAFAQDHPMHLHGHDFMVLGSGYGMFDSNLTSGLNFINPPRRDVAMMPASGYLVIAFVTNNPGVCIDIPESLSCR